MPTLMGALFLVLAWWSATLGRARPVGLHRSALQPHLARVAEPII